MICDRDRVLLAFTGSAHNGTVTGVSELSAAALRLTTIRMCGATPPEVTALLEQVQADHTPAGFLPAAREIGRDDLA